MVLDYLAARYGGQIIKHIAEHGHPAVLVIIVARIAAVFVAFYFRQGSKHRQRAWSFGERRF
jgi:hypothetical protein